jgi:Flp pilus assembly protein TadG
MTGILKRASNCLSRGPLRRIAGDRRGVAALEFALIAPLLLSMYFLTMEVGQGIEANKKIGRAASMVADLVTQQQTTTKEDLNAILNIGSAILQPYNRSKPTIVITAIEVTDETTPKVKVVWSRKLSNGTYSVDAAAGSITTVPSALRIKGSFLIRVQSSLTYYPVITWAAGDKGTLGLTAAFDKLSMNETYYLRPRMTQSISCSNC